MSVEVWGILGWGDRENKQYVFFGYKFGIRACNFFVDFFSGISGFLWRFSTRLGNFLWDNV